MSFFLIRLPGNFTLYTRQTKAAMGGMWMIVGNGDHAAACQGLTGRIAET